MSQPSLPNSQGIDLPKWRCHKVVGAAKISHVSASESPRSGRTVYWLHLEEIEQPIELADGWLLQHRPKAGGYFVRYEDGYESFSPAKAFEEGYTRLDEAARRDIIDTLHNEMKFAPGFGGEP